MAGCLGAGQYRTYVLVSERRPGDDRDEGRVDIRGCRAFPWRMRPARPPVRRLVPIWLGAVLALGLLPSATLVGGVPPARAATEIRPRITGIQPLSHEVYGYLPYWRLDAGTVDRINYNLVSTIAFFGLGIKSTGAIDRDWVGYKEYVGDAAAAVTNAAHDKGVRVVPTFQLFDSKAGYPKMTKFLTEPGGPGPVHRRGARPHGRAQGRRRRPRLRRRSRPEPAGQVLRALRRQVPRRDEGPVPGLDPGQRDVGRGERADHQGARAAGRLPDGDDLQLPLLGLGRHRRDRAARQRRAQREDPHGPDPAVGPGRSRAPGRAVLRLQLAGHEQGPPRDRPVEQEEVRRGQERHVRERARTSSRPTRR